MTDILASVKLSQSPPQYDYISLFSLFLIEFNCIMEHMELTVKWEKSVSENFSVVSTPT